jgi:SAM-dependent methyltransferase
MNQPNPYESEALLNLPDGSMHPGGLRLTARAARLAGLHAGMAVADIGCGTGASAEYLSRIYRLTAVGLDISQELIGLGLAQRPGVNLVHGNGERLPFARVSLDAILAECSLSLLQDLEHTLAQCYEALRPGGSLIVTDIYARKSLADGTPQASPRTQADLVAMITQAAFEIAVVEDHTPALRTFVALLAEQCGGLDKTRSLFCTSPGRTDIKLSELGYVLIVAKKGAPSRRSESGNGGLRGRGESAKHG